MLKKIKHNSVDFDDDNDVLADVKKYNNNNNTR